MYLIVGLGNPGKKYLYTRHNAGFIAVDYLSIKYNISVSTKYKKSYIGNGKISDAEIILMKPLTYMNLSGTVVKSALVKWKIKPENLIVIYDDFNLPFGMIRIRKSGSSGGHNGVESIITELNNNNFIRIRIGIGKNESYSNDIDYVLSQFSEDEFNRLRDVLKYMPDIMETIINYSVERAMNEFNRKKSTEHD